MTQPERETKRKRYYCKRIYKKINREEILKKREEEKKIIYHVDSEINYRELISKAGNEGNVHIYNKLFKCVEIYKKYKNMLNISECDQDGIWLEYPIINTENLSNYQMNKLRYLLSLYEKIEIKETQNKVCQIKNLHNIFNSNLKSKLRGRKSLKSLDIIKIVDIAVVIDKKIIYVAEVVVNNKLTNIQHSQLETISKTGGFEFEVI